MSSPLARLQNHVQKGSWKTGALNDLKGVSLYVVSADREHLWAGEYIPYLGQVANGLPIWRKEGSDYWLYACNDGTWGIGGKDVRTRKFRGSQSFVYSPAHKGQSPDKVKGSWTWHDTSTEKWIQDKNIKIFRNVPTSLHVSLLYGHVEKGGVYNLVNGVAPNGLPLWLRKDDEGMMWWMYSCPEGHWCIGGRDVKEKNFQCSSGFIFSKPHNSMMPNQTVGVWTRLNAEAGQWHEDPTITVYGAIPQKLHVAPPHGPELVAGEYILIAGKTANKWPIWKKAGEDLWLYSCTDETWGIGGSDVKARNFDCRAGFLFSAPHNGLMPDKMNGTWMRYGAGSWNLAKGLSENAIDVFTKGAATKQSGGDKLQEDQSIMVFRNLPKLLHVVLQNGPEFCEGEYELEIGSAANYEPVWKKKGADFWLYSCTDGTWAVGAIDVSLKKFKSQSGFIFSPAHGGSLPDKTLGLWSRWHEKQRRWIEDPSIGVFRDVPAKIHVALPNGPRSCRGEYVHVPAAVANGKPVWCKLDQTVWIASLPDGTWGLCGRDIAEKGFQGCAAFIHSGLHHGEMPHKLAGSWTRIEKEQWVADPSIGVFGDVPQTLHVALPNGPAECSGKYIMAVEETANDLPVWRKQDGLFWLFSCVDGTWGISGDDVRQKGWTDEAAYAYSGPHVGEMPSKLGGTWTRFSPSQNSWVQDASIGAFSNVSEEIHVAMPGNSGTEEGTVALPEDVKSCAGLYIIVMGQSANCQPLWKKVDGDYWLYSCQGGKWSIGKSYEDPHAYIFSSPHNGIMPDQLTTITWHGKDPSNDKKLIDYDGIAVFAAAPEVLQVAIPMPGLEQLVGEYELMLGEAANGMPVWRKVGGDFWFYSCIDSSWGIGGIDAKEKKFKCSLGFIYSGVHNGLMPHKVQGPWRRHDDVEDLGIAITCNSVGPTNLTMLALPEPETVIGSVGDVPSNA